VWLPERHFHPLGGAYPNPALAAAALAVRTRRIRLRAGSVVLPLQDPVTIAEDWSFVDNLSGVGSTSRSPPGDEPEVYCNKATVSRSTMGMTQPSALPVSPGVRGDAGKSAAEPVGDHPEACAIGQHDAGAGVIGDAAHPVALVPVPARQWSEDGDHTGVQATQECRDELNARRVEQQHTDTTCGADRRSIIRSASERQVHDLAWIIGTSCHGGRARRGGALLPQGVNPPGLGRGCS
jgi:hypothetical protein